MAFRTKNLFFLRNEKKVMKKKEIRKKIKKKRNYRPPNFRLPPKNSILAACLALHEK